MTFVDKIVEFNMIAGTGGRFDTRKVALYIGLQLEEMAEKISSIPHGGELGKLQTSLEYHSKLFKEGRFDFLVENINQVEALDADVDLAVVALGGGIALGADISGACHEVMDSNLSKSVLDEDGNRVMLKDENGKVMKPDTFWKPELRKYLR